MQTDKLERNTVRSTQLLLLLLLLLCVHVNMYTELKYKCQVHITDYYPFNTLKSLNQYNLLHRNTNM